MFFTGVRGNSAESRATPILPAEFERGKAMFSDKSGGSGGCGEVLQELGVGGIMGGIGTTDAERFGSIWWAKGDRGSTRSLFGRTGDDEAVLPNT